MNAKWQEKQEQSNFRHLTVRDIAATEFNENQRKDLKGYAKMIHLLFACISPKIKKRDAKLFEMYSYYSIDFDDLLTTSLEELEERINL
ncbi:hypothetical protein BTVI_147691 [Pitangus sulphuratus]|nr:hypothetical protein BTVI_147691 [Pitangus sulphuratus]